MEYFNQSRQSHVDLINCVKDTIKEEDVMESCKFGDNTEHIFKNGKYLLTINWSIL